MNHCHIILPKQSVNSSLHLIYIKKNLELLHTVTHTNTSTSNVHSGASINYFITVVLYNIQISTFPVLFSLSHFFQEVEMCLPGTAKYDFLFVWHSKLSTCPFNKRGQPSVM